jgi:hypothetical protein
MDGNHRRDPFGGASKVALMMGDGGPPRRCPREVVIAAPKVACALISAVPSAADIGASQQHGEAERTLPF